MYEDEDKDKFHLEYANKKGVAVKYVPQNKRVFHKIKLRGP